MACFLENDFKYSINIRNDLNINDYKTLVSLYQPLIGSTAIGVFLTLTNEYTITSKMKEPIFSKNRILKITKLSNEELNNVLNLLISWNLIFFDTNEDKKECYLSINKPKNYNDFLYDVENKKLLINILGEEDYEATKFLVKINNNKNTSSNSYNDDKEVNLYDFERFLLEKFNLELSFEEAHKINQLQTTNNVSNEIINLLLEYCYNKNSGYIIGNYISKIYNTLLQKNIFKLNDVKRYLNSLSIKKKPNNILKQNIFINEFSNKLNIEKPENNDHILDIEEFSNILI